MKTHWIAAAIAIGGSAFVGCGVASAQVTFTGFTNLCFGSGCTPESTSAAASDFFAGLTYNNSTFNVVSAGGVAGLGSTGSANPAANVDNLGSWSLTGSGFNYGGNSATLRVSFTAPPGTTPGSALFTNSVSGTVVATDNGGVFIDFDNTPHEFTFAGGTFDLLVNDVALTPGATPVPETGFLVGPNTQVSLPEPATLALLSLGLAGLAASRRRKTN